MEYQTLTVTYLNTSNVINKPNTAIDAGKIIANLNTSNVINKPEDLRKWTTRKSNLNTSNVINKRRQGRCDSAFLETFKYIKCY